MNELFQPVLAFLLFTLLLIPFFIVLGALFPKRVAKTRDVLDLMPGRSFGIGLVNSVFFISVGVALLAIGEKAEGLVKAIVSIPALLILSFFFVLLSFGLAGMVNLIGERIAPTQSGWQRTLWGTLVLGVGSAVPLVGWFLLLPYAGCLAVGAFIASFFSSSRPPLPKE